MGHDDQYLNRLKGLKKIDKALTNGCGYMPCRIRKQDLSHEIKVNKMSETKLKTKPGMECEPLLAPVRIQRKRIKGWRMPENTIYVGRPNKWGNPIILEGDCIYIDVHYRRKYLYPGAFYSRGDINDVLHLYWHILNGAQFTNVDLQYWSDKFKAYDIKELKGKNLACFCSLDKPCHVDELLRRANE